MKINVKSISPYAEVKFVHESATIETGTLAAHEMLDLAEELTEAASVLIRLAK